MSLVRAAEREDIAAWPVNFAASVRAEIIARDTMPGEHPPRCVVCGDRITGRPRIHHVLPKRRGGRGRYSNGITVHDECHARVHKQGTDSMANGWLRSQYKPKPGVYETPVNCWWRNPGRGAGRAVPYLIVLLDVPGDDGLFWRPDQEAA